MLMLSVPPLVRHNYSLWAHVATCGVSTCLHLCALQGTEYIWSYLNLVSMSLSLLCCCTHALFLCHSATRLRLISSTSSRLTIRSPLQPCSSGNILEMTEILRSEKVDIDCGESYGHHTALHLAVKGGQVWFTESDRTAVLDRDFTC